MILLLILLHVYAKVYTTARKGRSRMKEIICYIGYPGFGKSTIIKRDQARYKDSVVFHYGHMLKKPEDYFSDLEKWLDSSDIQETMNYREKAAQCRINGELCQLENETKILTKLFFNIAKKHTLLLDGFPRNKKQAEILANLPTSVSCVYLRYDMDKDISELNRYFSFYGQYRRDIIKKGNVEMVTRKVIRKIEVFEENILDILDSFQNKINVVNVPHVFYDQLYDKKSVPFDSVVTNDGKAHFATENYFYPLDISTYQRVYNNYTIDKYPAMVTMTLINKCADQCVGCFNANQTDEEMIDISILKKLVKDLARNGCQSIKVAGREPTCYPYLDEFLNTCQEEQIRSVVITGGARLHQFKEVFKEQCDFLRVSLNALTEEKHTKIHNPDETAISFNERLEILKEIVPERHKKRLTTGVTFLVRDNEDDLIPFIKMCGEIGVDFVRFSVLNYFNDVNKNEELINKAIEFSHDGFAVRYHEQYHGPDFESNIPCPSLASRGLILANGDVVSCHNSNQFIKKGLNPIYGNINEEDFDTIWKSEKRKIFINQVFEEMQDSYRENGSYTCENVNCGRCKYSGFNKINRWLNGEGQDAKEEYLQTNKPAVLKKTNK